MPSYFNRARERGVTLKLQAFLLFIFLSTVFSQQVKAPPTFEDFPAAESLVGRPAAPVLRTRSQKMFRTRIREGVKIPPNFAGRYSVIEWGCGSPCSTFVLVDLQTGKVYDPPFESFAAFDVECPEPYDNCLGEGLIFKPSSRLLIVDGELSHPDGKFGRYYYVWRHHQFKLIRADIKRHD
jgi:hypothetical protein